ncbi:MAG: DUF4304 domain-containing protein [Candidatus Dormibacteria bacterium]|jgi:hypothetical protein
MRLFNRSGRSDPERSAPQGHGDGAIIQPNAPTSAQAVFAELLREVAPLYRQAGFHRQGGSFYRSGETCLHVVNYQKSQSSSKAEIRFTVNVGIASWRLLAFFARPDPPPKTVPEYKCHVRWRIGKLLGRGDLWWVVGAGGRVPATEQQAIVRDTILPWLDAHGSDSGLVHLLLQRAPSKQAVLTYEAVLLHRPETYRLFKDRLPSYQAQAARNGVMEWTLEKLAEEQAAWADAWDQVP